MLVQGGIRLAGTTGLSANLEAGVELFREDYTAVNVGLNLAWEF